MEGGKIIIGIYCMRKNYVRRIQSGSADHIMCLVSRTDPRDWARSYRAPELE